MSIPFVQYKRPDGRQVAVEIQMPKEVEKRAFELIDMKCRFECEVLMSGMVSFTCEHDLDDDGDEVETIGHEICNNGPEVPLAIAKLVDNSYKIMKDNHATGTNKSPAGN